MGWGDDFEMGRLILLYELCVSCVSAVFQKNNCRCCPLHHVGAHCACGI